MIKNNLKMSEELEDAAEEIAKQLLTQNGSVMVDSPEDEEGGPMTQFTKMFTQNIDPDLLEKVMRNGSIGK